MSLLEEFREDCHVLEKTRTPDGLGGYTVAWTDGAPFHAAFEYESAPEVTVAEKQGVARTYRIYVPRSLLLDVHDVFKRDSDGAVFRVTNSGVDRKTPASAALDLRLIECERWELP